MKAVSTRATWIPTAVCLALGCALPTTLPAQVPSAVAPTFSAFLATAPRPAADRADGRRAGMASSTMAAARPTPGTRFLERQLRETRVRAAHAARAGRIEDLYERAGVDASAEVFFRVFKREQVLEVWARDRDAAEFVLLSTYAVCKVPGRLGPKRRQGDRQMPEGFYSIDLFNPRSSYHLSMRVDYPNAVDRARGRTGPLGGDIYIHGGCATIGCVPLTDAGIEEVYLLAALARDAGQDRIPIHIFPTRLDDAGLGWLARTYGADFADFAFWQNLRDGYLAFESTRTLPRIEADGPRYAFPAAAGDAAPPAVAILPAPPPGLN